MNGINVIIADDLKKWDCDKNIDINTWVCCRPMGVSSISDRFKHAWSVFTGKADVLVWRGNQ
jgi:hypothetical protein